MTPPLDLLSRSTQHETRSTVSRKLIIDNWKPRQAERARWIAYQWHKGHKRYLCCFGQGPTKLEAILAAGAQILRLLRRLGQ